MALALKSAAKSALLPFPFVSHPLWKFYYRIFPKDVAYTRPSGCDDRGRAFSEIFQDNEWSARESRSGSGSALATTVTIRRQLPQLVKRLSVKTILDAPCGDFNWMKYVQFPEGVNYIGADIVPTLIADLSLRHSGHRRTFFKIDLVEDPLPKADFWLCRHALFHLPNKDNLTILDKFLDSTIQYILTSNHDFCKANHDVNPGGYRFLNLRRPPFNLPKPLLKIDDFDMLGPPCVLALWSRKQVQKARAGAS